MSNEPTAGRRARRHALLDISLRKQRPGSGSRLTLNDRLGLVWPDLTETLQGIRWAIVGAVATRYYMPQRTTRELDIAVHVGDVEMCSAVLEATGYARETAAPRKCQWRSPQGVALEVIEATEQWWADAFADAKTNPDEHGCPVLTLPYLVLMKSLSMRPQDTADVSRMLGFADDAMLGEVRRVIARHSPADSEDLESTITLGKLEHQGQ